MKIVPTLLAFLSVTVAEVEKRQDLVAYASEGLMAAPASEAPYTGIDDTCNHPVLLSAASFASNFFCENVLKVAVEDLACEGLFFEVLAAQVQIVDGANFRQTVVLGDDAGDCVIAFKSKIYMPMPHSGTEPQVDMDELLAVGCDDDDIKFEPVCFKSLSVIDAYWEEDIENGGGAEPINSLAEEEKAEEEELEMIEAVEEDLEGGEIPAEPEEDEGTVGAVASVSDSLEAEDSDKGGFAEVKEEEVYGGGKKKTKTSNSTKAGEEVYGGQTQPAESVLGSSTSSDPEEVLAPADPAAVVNTASSTVLGDTSTDVTRSQEAASPFSEPEEVLAPADPTAVVNIASPTVLGDTNTAVTNSHEPASPFSEPAEEFVPADPTAVVNAASPTMIGDTNTDVTSSQEAASSFSEPAAEFAPADPTSIVNAALPAVLGDTNTDVTSLAASPFSEPAEEFVPTDPTSVVNAALSTELDSTNTNVTSAQEAATEALEAQEEVLEEVEAELVEEISAFAEEVEAEAEIHGEQMTAYEMEEEQYEDESTWAYAGKTDECSRFGVSPAEGIAFKCDKTVYICGETMAFREKFLLLLQDPVVDFCDLGEVKEIYSSRGDCNFFPKNEHYLQRDGSQRQGHNLYCPNGATLDSYYMFCSQELDNYYCNGDNCGACEVTGRRRGKFLRH